MILLISGVFPPEPVVSASITNDLAEALSEIGEVIVITPKPSRPFGFSFMEESIKVRKFQHIVLNSFTCPESKLIGRMRESYSFGKHAAQFIMENPAQIDCIYINAWPIFAQYLIVKAARKNSIPTVIHIQDIYPESLVNKIPLFGSLIGKILLPIDIFVLRNVSRIIAISENMRDTFVETRGISTDKINILHNWQDESEFIKYHELKVQSGLDDSNEKAFKFLYLGNIGPVAGVDFLINSFAKANLSGAILIIAGSGSKKKECIKLAESYKNLKIEFWDVPSGKVPETHEYADVLLLPLRLGASMSSIPSKLPAYMFSAKPVIACVDEDSDTANSIKQADCGWIVKPENIDGLTKAMKTAISMKEKDLQRLGRNGFNYAIENFSKKNNLHELVNIVIETAEI